MVISYSSRRSRYTSPQIHSLATNLKISLRKTKYLQLPVVITLKGNIVHTIIT